MIKTLPQWCFGRYIKIISDPKAHAAEDWLSFAQISDLLPNTSNNTLSQFLIACEQRGWLKSVFRHNTGIKFYRFRSYQVVFSEAIKSEKAHK